MYLSKYETNMELCSEQTEACFSFIYPFKTMKPVVSLVHKAGGSRNGLQHFPVIKILTVFASSSDMSRWMVRLTCMYITWHAWWYSYNITEMAKVWRFKQCKVWVTTVVSLSKTRNPWNSYNGNKMQRVLENSLWSDHCNHSQGCIWLHCMCSVNVDAWQHQMIAF